MQNERGQKGRGRQPEVVPPDPLFASTPPPTYSQPDYSFAVQAIFEMQKTQGQLTEAVTALREAQRETHALVTATAQKVNTAQTVIWVVGVGLMAIIGLVGWLITNAISLLPSLLHNTN